MGMITELDVQVGRIVAELEKKGLRDNTIILFASDNGGATSGLFAQGAKSNEEREHDEGGIEQGQKAPANNAPFSGGKGSLKEGGVRVPAFVNWPAKLKPRTSTSLCTWSTSCRRCWRWRAVMGSPDHPFDGRDMWKTLAEGAPSPTDDVLINVELFRGAVRKGDWKLIKIALLPGKTELYNLAKDPGETTNVAAENPEVARDLEARLLQYAREQKPSLWIKAQPAFVGAQGKTVMDPDFDIDDGGLPHEKLALPH